MKSRVKRQILLPVWGYVVLNVIVLVVFVAIHLVSVRYAEENNFISTGLVPVLAICYLAFLIVSIMDALFDRMALRKPPPPPPKPERSSTSSSRETQRRLD